MKEDLLQKTTQYIVGVSGGCDSMYLLDTLRLQGYNVVVAHVNYHLREDSDLDTELVKDYCNQYAIPLHIKECDPQAYHHGNFQANAREIRYAFYKEVALQYHANEVLLAHHRDDFIETAMMQLEKGTHHYYLGIKEISHVYDLIVVRPLLDEYKESIRNKCDTLNIPYRDDYTNFETQFKRDAIRNTILNQYSYNEKEAYYHKILTHNNRILEIEKRLKPYLDLYYKQTFINYKELDRELLPYFIYKILYDLLNDTSSEALVNEVMKQILSDAPNICVTLPVNNQFIKEYDNIYASKKVEVKDYEYVIDKNQFIETPYFKIAETGHIHTGIMVKDEEYPLTIRNFRNGDRVVTSGGTKKVSRLFINNKIPKSKRNCWPIVLNCYGEIILIPHITKNLKHYSTNANIFVII